MAGISKKKILTGVQHYCTYSLGPLADVDASDNTQSFTRSPELLLRLDFLPNESQALGARHEA